MSTLTLNISSGFLHKNYDLVGKMQNYVYMKLTTSDGRSQQFRSKIVLGQAKKPIQFNQTTSFNISRNSFSSAKLEVQLRDEDVSSDDVCGKGFVNLEHCGLFQQQNIAVPYTIRLYGGKGSQITGELSFTSVLN